MGLQLRYQLIRNMAACAQFPRIREVRAYVKKKASDDGDQGIGQHILNAEYEDT